MNYRHAYHAGNFADVLKHIVLVQCLLHLKKKTAPFRVVDTHAGAGLTDLSGAAAAATGEWHDGIGRIFGADAQPLSSSARDVAQAYFDLLSQSNPRGALQMYPGSPLLVRAMLRAGDTLVAGELHPSDAAELKAALAGDKACRVEAQNGYTLIKALLPPKERRGLVLVDPPFEEPGEFIRMTEALSEGLARFATGTYVFWYPIKDEKPVQRFHRGVAEVCVRQKLEPALVIELMLRPARNPHLLNGCGLVVVNPPFTLEDEMHTLLPELAHRLGDDGKGEYRIAPLGVAMPPKPGRGR